MNRRGESERDWVEFWWKAIIYGAICTVLVVAVVNSFRERNNCPTSTEREYVEEVDATVIWFDTTNTELDKLFSDAARNSELYMNDNWKESVKHHAGTLYLRKV